MAYTEKSQVITLEVELDDAKSSIAALKKAVEVTKAKAEQSKAELEMKTREQITQKERLLAEEKERQLMFVEKLLKEKEDMAKSLESAQA